MGLSASQARLLSITSRLSDNELRSQTLTTAKMSLANRTTEASAEYMDALNSTKLLYSTYDSDGNKIQQSLTGASLSEYAELKNQYGLINKNNQILVSELDAANYESSANLEEFLDKYGVLSEPGEGEMVQVVNPDWQTAWDEYNEEYEIWMSQKPDKNDEIYWDERTSTSNELYQKFRNASASCYSNALGGSSGCYQHVLAHLLMAEFPENGSNTYQTSANQSIEIGWGYINGSAINSAGKTPDMNLVSQEVVSQEKIIYAAENEANKQRLLAVYNDPNSTEQEKQNALLTGNYYIDSNGDAQLKTLKQKCIDLFYVLSNYGSMGLDYDADLIPLLQTFQKDMEQAFKEKVFLEDKYNTDYNKWLANEPDKPDVPYYIEEEQRKIVNKDKGQWYVNLWHRMNGESETKAGTTGADGEIVEGGTTSTGLPLYKVLEDGLMNNADWLQYALNNGTVTLERVQFTDPTEEGTGLADCTWTSIIWTNAADISEEENEAAVTMAEVKYEQALKDIEAKDKQYDNRLKLLDTEHNALQTEYESVKSVIDKNVERTLKIYS